MSRRVGRNSVQQAARSDSSFADTGTYKTLVLYTHRRAASPGDQPRRISRARNAISFGDGGGTREAMSSP